MSAEGAGAVARRSVLAAAVLLVMTGGAVAPAAAQDPVARGDELVRAGRVFAAESVYYWATTSSPRDPRARFALGRHLGARGALRTAATLMEEARFFGGDAAAIAIELASVYERLGEYRALASLPSSPLSPAEQTRAVWLRDNRPTQRAAAEIPVPLRPPVTGAIGGVLLRIGRDTVTAELDPAIDGIVLDTTWLRHRALRRFGSAPDQGHGVPAVATSVSIGDLMLGNVPVDIMPVPPGARARIGLDFVARFSPTFDEGKGTLILRPGARAGTAGTRLPLYAPRGGTWIVHGGRLVPLASPEGRALRGMRWGITRSDLILLPGG